MLPHLPYEIKVQIMKKLPVKSLLRFRSVSKTCKSMIDSSHFIKAYDGSHLQHLLVVSYDKHGFENREYVSVVDDDTFPQQKVSLFVPESVKKLKTFTIIGSSGGLLCLCGLSYISNCPKRTVVIWNISIRKAVAVVVPEPRGRWSTLGFGVCRETNDPKIIKMDMEVIKERDFNMPWQVEVFSLSTGAWRSVVSNNIPLKSIRLTAFQVVIDGAIYGLGYDMDNENMIISFDITREEFRRVNLPDSLAGCESHGFLYIYKLRNSLVVLQAEKGSHCFIVWMMEDGISVSFKKLYTVYHPHARLAEFRKNGEPILERSEGNDSSLAVYEPYTKHIESIGFHGTRQRLHVSSYMETLHLHDHLDSIVYKGKSALYRKTMKQPRMKVDFGKHES